MHEVAHQWFGNMVTVGSWGHTWIQEGLTTYMSINVGLAEQERKKERREEERWITPFLEGDLPIKIDWKTCILRLKTFRYDLFRSLQLRP